MKIELVQSFESYFKHAADSTETALASHEEAVVILKKIHHLFEVKLSSISAEWRPTQGLLILNSLMIWLSSIRVATTAHSPSTFPLFRSSLESACYAYRIWALPDLEQVWLDRHHDDKSLRKSKKAFTSAVKDTAKDLESRPFVSPGTGDWINDAYDQSINFGAHPNPRSILPSLRFDAKRNDEMISLEIPGVLAGDSLETERMLLAAIDYGQLIALIAGCCSEEPDHNIMESLAVINGSKEAYVADRFS